MEFLLAERLGSPDAADDIGVGALGGNPGSGIAVPADAKVENGTLSEKARTAEALLEGFRKLIQPFASQRK